MINVNSDRVKKWRRVTKQRMIESLGGKCAICGYNKCNDALEFHHVNPDEKEFEFGRSRANIKSWDALVVELRKCVLLCAICHREYHAGLIDQQVINNLPRFDEQYSSYDRYPNKSYDECPICGELKPISRVTCSKSCAGKKPKKVDWNTVDLVSLLSEYTTYERVGSVLGVTGAAVKRKAVQLNITRWHK